MKIIANTLSTSSVLLSHAKRNGIIRSMIMHEHKYKIFVGFPLKILKYNLNFSVYNSRAAIARTVNANINTINSIIYRTLNYKLKIFNFEIIKQIKKILTYLFESYGYNKAHLQSSFIYDDVFVPLKQIIDLSVVFVILL